MAKKYFGTDGIRGKVGVAPITPDFVMAMLQDACLPVLRVI
jgi:phosphoglucosamine mutase